MEECLNEFKRFITDKHDGNTYDFNYDELNEGAKEIFDRLIEIKNTML